MITFAHTISIPENQWATVLSNSLTQELFELLVDVRLASPPGEKQHRVAHEVITAMIAQSPIG